MILSKIKFQSTIRFGTYRRLLAHCKKQNQHKCEICSHQFCTANELTAHRRHGCKELIETIGSPHVDGKRTVMASNRAAAEENDTWKQPIGLTECEFCRRNFSNISNLRFHQRKAHALEYQYNCDECGELFAYKRQLTAHLLMHSGAVHECLSECWLCHQT